MTYRKFAKSSEKHNNIDKLNDGLKNKYDLYYKTKSGTLINNVFTWKEFKEVFQTVTVQFTFQYENIMFTVFNSGKYSEFWIDGDDKNSYQRHISSIILLENILIDNHWLSEIWTSVSTV